MSCDICEERAAAGPEYGISEEDDACPNSERPCGHHCNHVGTHDSCCWCGAEWGEEGVRTDG